MEKQLISAKGIKKGLKSYGVKVLRCSQNGLGVLLTIESSVENQEKAIYFMSEFDLTVGSNSKPKVRNTELNYIDYGNVNNWK